MPEHQQVQQSKKTNTIFQKQATSIIQTPASNPYSIIQRAKINPKSLNHADVMQLQHTIGNQAVGRLLSSIGSSSTAQQATVQRQEIHQDEEPCPSCMQRQENPEEEPLQGKMIEPVQRQETLEEEEPLQGKFENNPGQVTCPSCFAAPIVQKQESEEEEKPLQGKMIGTIQRQEIPEEEPLQGKMAETIQRQEIPEEEEPLQPKRENNTGMPDNLKAGVENLSGIDMSEVRVQYNSSKPAEVGALAYTQGTDIHVASGQEQHLPHETWHVVQQVQGKVKPTIQMKNGINVNDDAGLENEATVMGGKTLQLESLSRVIGPMKYNRLLSEEVKDVAKLKGNESNDSAPVQRKIGDSENVIFGLNGKNEDAIKNAVDANYTTFDAADSYGNTNYLKEAIQIAIRNKRKSRNDFEIIYKVDITEPAGLERHLREIANMFGGYIDHVLIHKVTDRNRAAQYSPYLHRLKDAGVIKNLGSGDAKTELFDQLQEKDSFEIDAHDLFLAPDAELLIKKLNESKKPVFVYNIIFTLKALLNIEPAKSPQQSQISAIVNMIKGKVPKAEPILSSKSKEQIYKNLEIYTPQDEDKAFSTYGEIDKGVDEKRPSVPIAEMKQEVKNKLRAIVFNKDYKWGAESLFADPLQYKKELDLKSQQFTKEELSIRCKGDEKTFTLEQLLGMLFEQGNCHRVEAYNFLAPGLI